MEGKEMEERKIEECIGEHGLRVEGVPLIWTKLDKLIELMDRNNFLLSMIEKKIDKIIEKNK